MNELKTTPSFYELKLLKIAGLFRYEVDKLMYQRSKQSLLAYFTSIFTNLTSIHHRQTTSHSMNKSYSPKFSTSQYQRSIKFQGTKTWKFFSQKLKNA